MYDLTGHKPYNYGTCGKSFTLQNSLKLHMYDLTGHKPYSHGTCGKSCTHKNSL